MTTDPGVLALYQSVAADYAQVRRPDERIARRIELAIGDARSVVNVGAGTGSYEPRDRLVTAVEPSSEMAQRRPKDAGRCVQAAAEALPFEDASFDAAMTVLSLHHWTSFRRGVAEMRRVSRGRVVIFTWDPAFAMAHWLVAEYLPEIAPLDVARFPPIAALIDLLPGAIASPVPIAHDCTDAFFCASWRRPERYLDPQVRNGSSVFAQLPQATLDAGIARLRVDLASGAWHARHASLLEKSELDLGYRLIVAAPA
jgi:SAM-dependent methyltransferase